MSRAVNSFFLVIGLVGIFGGLAVRLSTPFIAYLVIGLGITSSVLALILDNRHVKRVNSEQHEQTRRRIAELTRTPWASNQSLKVTGNSLWMLVVSMLMSIACIAAISLGNVPDARNWLMVFGGAFFLPFSLLMIPRCFTCLGKPACVLDRDGITTPINGRVTWKEIDGVHLQTMNYRGAKSFYLIFRVSDRQTILKNAHWTERALSLIGLGAIRRRVISIQLDHPNAAHDTPETMAAVATFLWRQASGLVHDWNPMFSTDHNDAAKRVAEVMARHQNSDAINDYVSSQPEKALTELGQLRTDMETLHEERLKLSSRAYWMVRILIGVSLILTTWPLWKRLL